MRSVWPINSSELGPFQTHTTVTRKPAKNSLLWENQDIYIREREKKESKMEMEVVIKKVSQSIKWRAANLVLSDCTLVQSYDRKHQVCFHLNSLIESCDEQRTSYSETFMVTTSRKFHSIYMWKKPHITTQLFSCFPQTIDFGSLPTVLLHLISKIRNTGQTSRISCFAWVLFICGLSFFLNNLAGVIG